MRRIDFAKMVASGNDFVVLDSRPSRPLAGLARAMCDRKFGAGADGLLFLSKVAGADLAMRIINADGSEAEMCGNGARCAVLWAREGWGMRKKNIRLKTQAGMIDSEIRQGNIRIRLTDPRDLRPDLKLKINGRAMHCAFINTGVPHAVVFTDDAGRIDVACLGSRIRYHAYFSPRGTNVDFAEPLNADSIKVRTYERGVEDETLACGTGSVAAALVFAFKGGRAGGIIKVHTKSGEVLKVYFTRKGDKFRDVWLEGSARVVYQGAYYV